MKIHKNLPSGTIVRALTALFACAAIAVFPLSCGKRGAPVVPGGERQSRDSSSESTADAEVVSSHVSGAISSEARIIVRFVEDIVEDAKTGKGVPSKAASISPSAPGDFIFADRKTIEFKPSKPLARGFIYKITINPSELGSDRIEGKGRFFFNFMLLSQAVSLGTGNFESSGGKDISDFVWTGVVTTADIADPGDVEKALSAELDGKKAAIAWTHGKLEHGFKVTGLKKKGETQSLVLALKGSIVAKGDERSVKLEVPASSPLRAEKAVPVESPDRHIEISFSDPLLKDQDFRGFISAKPQRQLRFSVEGSVLKVYSQSDWGDTFSLSVKKGVKNAAGEGSKEDFEFSLSFKPILPEVRFIGNGVIVPGKLEVTVPIETINVSGIIARVEKIYADKIDQFLQVNELSGSDELHRVGKTVWEKIIPVPFSEARRNQWVRTALDLSPLIREDDHSLYRVTLSFDMRMSEYPGANVPENELMSFNLKRLDQTGPSADIRQLGEAFWNAYVAKDRSDYDWDDYYHNRNNPNHPAFYDSYFRHYYGENEDRYTLEKSRNFLVSDLGVIAQVDANGLVTAAVTSLLSAQPVKDALVTVYDFQQRVIAQGRTDGNGFSSLRLQEAGYLLVAETKDDKGFLKLQGASNLPVSHFDVAGQAVQQGVKGFIYGERGVWRPGDPIYLTFILKDANKVLPPEHPVVLRFYDPSGKLVKTMAKDEGVGDFYHFALKTGQDDPTGTYSAKVSVGGISFSKDVPVEAIKPNRLKIDAGFGEGVTELGTEPARARISAVWLHGAVAGDMKTEVSVRFASTPTTFPGYKDYAFDDPVRTFKSESVDVYSGDLDSRGNAEFTVNLNAGAVSPGKLAATFRTRVYEPGGNINADSFSIPFNPYPRYAGLSIPDADKERGWLDVEQPHAVKIALLDTAGKGVDGSVDVDVYEIGWRWWWDMEDDDIADYLGTKNYRLVQSERVKVAKGAAEWTLKFKERQWGRFLIRVKDKADGHMTGRIVYMRWPGWYYSSPEEGGDSASMLVFSADKPSYSVSETAKITIPTADKGRALLSIENNGKLLSTEWIEAKAGQTVYDLKITPAMSPNVYVHVSMVQPHGQTVNDRPIRMFGIIPLLVDDPGTRLSPVVSTADTYEPNGIAKLSVSEKTGKPMTYTVALVDEGLLNITRFRTPDPRADFFRRDALAVNTFDVYGFVAAAYGGTLERLLAVGGSEEGDSGDGRKANRFPPMVKFLGPFTLPAGKSENHEIQMPQYVGAVRVMVVAGNDGAYGFAEKTVPVKKPVMVYATLPRVVSVTERFALPATVFALEDGVKSVDVSVKTNGKIIIDGPSKKTLQFAKPGDQLVTFDAMAGNALGIAEVEVTASSGKVSSTQKIEIDVRSPNPPVTAVDPFFMKKGEARDVSVKLPGLPGSNKVSLELSRIAPIDLENRLGFLIHYPYGCIEQTTSSVFPQLYLDKISDLDAAQAAEVRKNVQAGIDRLRSFQTYSGGLGYWPGDASPSAWGTTYAAHFILEAEKLGYIVPAGLKRGLVSYLKSQAGAWAWNADRVDYVQAYALYDLALAGEPDLGAMNRMRERNALPPEVKFKLAGAYALSGQKDEALRLTEGKIPVISPYKELGGTYGSDLRDLAVLGEGLIECGSYDAAAPIISEVSKSLSTGNWYSTQTVSYCLLVVGKYLKNWKSEAPLVLTYEWAAQKGKIETSAPMKVVNLPLKSENAPIPLKLSNDSDQPVYVRVVKTGQAAPGNEKAVSNGLSLSVKYYDKTGRSLAVDALEQGTDIVAELSVGNPSGSRYYEELALEYVAPSGWEITNPRFEGWVQDKDKGFEYQDIRDDRVYTFLSLGWGQKKTLKLMMTAAYKGKYYLPQAKAEAMYDSSITASTEGRWISVTESAEE
jgi:alpha-2-macroglobulin